MPHVPNSVRGKKKSGRSPTIALVIAKGRSGWDLQKAKEETIIVSGTLMRGAPHPANRLGADFLSISMERSIGIAVRMFLCSGDQMVVLFFRLIVEQYPLLQSMQDDLLSDTRTFPPRRWAL